MATILSWGTTNSPFSGFFLPAWQSGSGTINEDNSTLILIPGPNLQNRILKHARVIVETAPPSGISYTYVIRVNKLDTQLTVVITEGNTVGVSDPLISVTVSSGDVVSVRYDNNGQNIMSGEVSYSVELL